MAAKPKENQRKSNNRGGPRTGSGRKPKAVTDIKNALISELAGTGEVPVETKNDAAAYAFRLFDKTMRDENIGVTIRLDCASEVLNRVWGKPKQAVDVTDLTAAQAPTDARAAAAALKAARNEPDA